ncbi:MAG: sialidase family protein [Anaerolineae bacterium]|nr:sialidase family protein [Anaerolineae bacterium]
MNPTWHPVKYQPERTQTYLGSPSLLRLPDGALLASHDYFGKGCPRNHEGEESLTSIYRSEDDGATWQNITHLMNCYWSTLFLLQDAVYILGVSQQYGSIVIRRSEDGGFTWTHPADEKSGLLFRGGYFHEPPNYHCAPVPVLRWNGRIYKGFEDLDPLQHGPGFQACVISASEDADLLDAASWIMSNKLRFDPAWIPDALGHPAQPGWLEGNLVAGSDGQLWNILRFKSAPSCDVAAMVRVSKDGSQLQFDPQEGFIDFPGGETKFTIRYDPQTQVYLSLVNNNTAPGWPNQRNVLSLSVSKNLRDWQVVTTLMSDDSGLSQEDSIRLTGFQYVDWQFDGDDIIYLVRAAYRGAIRYHDANYIIYRVLKNFRSYLGCC